MPEQYTLFISDLHLRPQDPMRTEQFLQFLQEKAQKAEALYILGDFFDLWIGDDDPSPWLRPIKASLKTLVTTHGIPTYFMPGNHDVLLGKSFSRETACILLDDPTLIELYGQRIVLKHGDDLCTKDVRHQIFRYYTQKRGLRRCFLALPLKVRGWIAKHVQHQSYKHHANDASIMTIDQAMVATILKTYHADCLIHGHTHRPSIAKNRCVLPAWEEGPAALCLWSSGKYAKMGKWSSQH